ncbi:MAG: TIGR02466 family protein [Pseudohongiellaceae bacterium]
MTNTMQNYDNTPPIKVEAQHLGFFETPVAYTRLKDASNLLSDLEAAIRSNMTKSEGILRSNIGGWHSDTDMMDWGGSAAAKLADTAVKICKRLSHFKESSVDSYDWTTKMWANVTGAGGLNQAHAHPGNLWAAVLYLDLGEEVEKSKDVGGAFFIEDPRFPMAAMHNTAARLIGVNGQPQQYEVEFNLEPGNLLVFPAWLRHGVRPYTGNRQRISIAMNIDVSNKS